MAEPVKRTDVLRRWQALKTERSSWVSHWQEISSYVLPWSGRYLVTERNKGTRKANTIYDSTATRALRTLAAGMMAGMTSPARPWFRLTVPDPELAKFAPVKMWLDEVTKLLLQVFARSNTYRALHSMYEELGAFGTGASIILPDFDDVIRHYPLTAGEYAIAQDARGEIVTLYREFQLTVGQMVQQFGLDAVSKTVRNQYDKGNLDAYMTVIHAIEPRRDRDPGKRDARNMPWRSCYFEPGDGGEDKTLRESGFRRFCAVAPRWNAQGGDIYGSSPAMEALGDVKQLQHQQLRKALGIDYQTKPPLQVPTSLKNREVDMLPGGITYADQPNAAGSIRTLFDVQLNLQHLLMDIQDVRGRIEGTFFADLFLMIANAADKTMTATEVAERHEEKLLMLGPVLERQHNELLSPKVDIAFDYLLDAGLVPPAPPELAGMDLDVEFVSMLAQAQRAVGTNSIDRFVSTLGVVAGAKPDVLDKFDADQWADVYSDMLGVDPALIVPAEQVAIVRKQRAEQQQAAQQLAAVQQGAAAAKDLAAAKTGEPSALTSVIDQFSGYTTA